MKIAVFGTGGVGGYFGGRLAQAGEDVTFIARGEHLRAIQERGLRVESLKGDFEINPARATSDPGTIGPVDGVIVGVKAWQVPEAAHQILPLVSPETFVIPLQNGVDAPGQLAEVIGREHVLGGLCHISAFVAEPGLIRHVGIEPSISFGELSGEPSERAERLRTAFERAGVTVQVPADIVAALWRKFLFIAAISGVGAVVRAPLGIVRSVPVTRQLLVQAMEETLAVSRAYSVQLPDEIVATTLSAIDSMQPGVIASMHRDLAEGRPSELDYQNGALVRLGQAVGVMTPLHAYLYASLLPLELRARGELSF